MSGHVSRRRRRTRGRECAAVAEPPLIDRAIRTVSSGEFLTRTRLTPPVHVTADGVDLDLVLTTATANRDPVTRSPAQPSGTTGSDVRAVRQRVNIVAEEVASTTPRRRRRSLAGLRSVSGVRRR